MARGVAGEYLAHCCLGNLKTCGGGCFRDFLNSFVTTQECCGVAGEYLAHNLKTCPEVKWFALLLEVICIVLPHGDSIEETCSDVKWFALLLEVI